MPNQNPKTFRHFILGGLTIGILISTAQFIAEMTMIANREHSGPEQGIGEIAILALAAFFSLTETIPACVIYGASTATAMNLLKINAPQTQSKLVASGFLLSAAVGQTINLVTTAISTNDQLTAKTYTLDSMGSLQSSESDQLDPLSNTMFALLKFQFNYFNSLTLAVYVSALFSATFSLGVASKCGLFKYRDTIPVHDIGDVELGLKKSAAPEDIATERTTLLN